MRIPCAWQVPSLLLLSKSYFCLSTVWLCVLVWVSLSLSCLKFLELLVFVDSWTSLNLGSFWPLFLQIISLALLPLSPGTLIMHILGCLVVFHSSYALFTFLHSFFFLLLRLNNFNFPIFKFTDFFLPPQICYWTPLVNWSFVIFQLQNLFCSIL